MCVCVSIRLLLLDFLGFSVFPEFLVRPIWGFSSCGSLKVKSQGFQVLGSLSGHFHLLLDKNSERWKMGVG